MSVGRAKRKENLLFATSAFFLSFTLGSVVRKRILTCTLVTGLARTGTNTEKEIRGRVDAILRYTRG